MGIFMHRAAAIIPAVLLALTGCQSFVPGAAGGLSGAREFNANFLPNAGTTPLDGSGTLAAELPKKKKLGVCLAAAKSMEKEGKLIEAIYYYEQVRELDPRNELVYTRSLATLYDRKGDFDKALDEYQKLLKANPKDSDAYNDLGYGYYNRGKFEVAEQNLRKAVECNPKNKRAWANLGMTLAQVGKYDESVSSFEKSVSKAQALCNVAWIQVAQGKMLEARDSYAAALKYEPGLQRAQLGMQSVSSDGSRAGRDRDRIEGMRRFREAEAARGPMYGAVGEAGADSGMLVLGPERPLDRPIDAGMVPSSASLPPIQAAAPPAPVRTTAVPVATAPSNLPPAPSPNVLSVD